MDYIGTMEDQGQNDSMTGKTEADYYQESTWFRSITSF